MTPNALPLSLETNPLLSQWIRFEQPGRVIVSTGRVEIGQGVLTALTQLAADELDLDPDQVAVVSGQSGLTPMEGWTAGSYSMSVGGRSVQMVCADVRRLFTHHIATLLACEASEILIERGRFLVGAEETGHDYWSIAAEVSIDREVTGSTPLKRRSEHKYIGRSFPRLDLPEKIIGAGFIHDDFTPGFLHARVLRQPWRDAELVELDEAAVQKLAGGPVEILRKGNFVALLSETEITAVRAVDAASSKALWRGGERVSDDIGGPDWLKRQPALDNLIETKNADGETVSEVVSETFWRPFITYASIGPSCAVADYTNGKLTVLTHSQGPSTQQEWLAKALGLNSDDVLVRHRHGSGAYGDNTADDAAFDAAYIAMQKPGRHVRVLWSRADEFTSAPFSPAMMINIRAGLGLGGAPQEWVTEIWSPPHMERPGANGDCNFVGAYALPNAPPRHEREDTPEARHGGATRGSRPIYDVPVHRLVHHTIPKIALKTSSLRGLGFWTNIFAIESMMDELAARTGQDPVAYRLALLSDPRARKVVESVARMSRWSEPRDKEGTALGIGFARYKNIAAYCGVVVEVSVEEDVTFRRAWCAADAGLVINPDGIRNQLEGAIIQGASIVLREQIGFEDGQVATRTFENYPILRFSEIPEIEIELIASDSDLPLGVGECAIGPVAGALGNAVSRSLDTRIRKLPLTRETIMTSLLE